jgi:hypothetical protein
MADFCIFDFFLEIIQKERNYREGSSHLIIGLQLAAQENIFHRRIILNCFESEYVSFNEYC